MDLYGLLHVADHGEAHVNLRGRGHPIDIYLRCAITCARSVAAQGSRFRLVTNDAPQLRRRAAAMGLAAPELVEHDFVMTPRRELAFYSAHFKLELLEEFARGRFGDEAGLIDIDTVLLKPLDLGPLPASGLFAYDISAAVVPHYGPAVVAADLAAVTGAPVAAPRWWGGEFFLGSPAGFARLVARTRECWPRYIAVADRLHHVGDEMVTASALLGMARDGYELGEAGRAGGVVRWWGTWMDTRQPALADVLDRSLLHLPADKPFLATRADKPFATATFLDAYRAALRRKIRTRRLAGAALSLIGRGGKWLPELS